MAPLVKMHPLSVSSTGICPELHGIIKPLRRLKKEEWQQPPCQIDLPHHGHANTHGSKLQHRDPSDDLKQPQGSGSSFKAHLALRCHALLRGAGHLPRPTCRYKVKKQTKQKLAAWQPSLLRGCSLHVRMPCAWHCTASMPTYCAAIKTCAGGTGEFWVQFRTFGVWGHETL